MTAPPAEEYRLRLDARQRSRDGHDRRALRISQLRLAAFAAALLLAVLAWRGTMSGWWIALPVTAFVLLVRAHDRVLRARDAAARAAAFYERGVARIADRWAGTGETGDRFRDDGHPYAADLDLFGHGSLFELLSSARTNAGEEILAGWLKGAATRVEVEARQSAVRELAGELDLREMLAVAGAEVRAGVHSDVLIAWAEGPALLASWERFAAMGLTAATLAGLAWLARTGDYLPFLAAGAAQAIFHRRQQVRIDAVLHGCELPARDLAIMLDLLRQLEPRRFASERLFLLVQRLSGDGAAASTVIQRLRRLVEAHDWEHNLVFTPVAIVLMWGHHVAHGIERWRLQHGRRIGVWLKAVGEIEALASLAAYHYEHPADPFPEIVASPEGARAPALLHASGLGHPLLPSARMVRNDVALGPGPTLLLVSGSNMSGKSTLLRTIGVNAVLALAGAPVRATSLRLTPVAIGATLRIQDSLQEGRSRFFAEISRLRTVVDLAAGPLPLLFLLDELFHGTNSHDRRIGASGVLHRLLELGAIGLITTHDLALTAITAQLGPAAANVHFEDRFEGGEMIFDYRMRPGPVVRSNALALMRAVGLQVGEQGEDAVPAGPPQPDPSTSGVPR